MPKNTLAPLRFAPIFKPALWGGSRLRTLFGAPRSSDPTGEAWLLSDYNDSLSVVAEGPQAGKMLRDLLKESPERIVGRARMSQGRFPILLKFIHARQTLSVQVHPTDATARELEGPTAVGKTEAWVVLEADPIARLYTGLLPGTTPERLRQAIASGNVEDLLFTHAPSPGDCLFLPAGTVHAIGAGVLLFEIQQTSDLTYRLFDWGRPRELHVEKGLASVDFTLGPCRPAYPTDEGHGRVRRISLAECEHFSLGSWDTTQPFRAGEAGKCRVLVGTAGQATIQHAGKSYRIGVGDVLLLPAEIGACDCVPQGPVTILECGLPE
jgi:mannose-6-phosphate isomerase